MKQFFKTFLPVSSVIFIILLIASCTDAGRSKIFGYGDAFKVELVNCDGSITHQWVSSGKVLSENGSDGYFFRDKKTNALIEVTGNLIITEVDKTYELEYSYTFPKDTNVYTLDTLIAN